jgi:hypothetical protein
MKRILSALLLVTLCLAAFPNAARADMAPPLQPPGSSLAPGSETTQVRMMAETVTIDVLDQDPPMAHVTALFTMRNLGSSTENLAARFPIGASDGYFGFPEIKNVGIKVNDHTTPSRRIEGPDPHSGFSDQNVPWAEFDVKFVPGEDVLVKVSYDLDGTSFPQDNYTNFYYILSTGAGWKGTIGSAEIILRLPYTANLQDVIPENNLQNAPQFIGREAHWKFTELEPTTNDNLGFNIIKPAIWKQVVIELDNVARNPKDGEAYGRLGKAYKAALFAAAKGFPRTDPGAVVVYEASKAAYDKAVTLKPRDGLWHAGFAELLLNYYHWTNFSGQYIADLDLGLNELRLANQFASQDPKVKELTGWFSSVFPDYIVQNSDGSLVFLSLTQTPTPMQEPAVPTGAATPTMLIPPTATTAPATAAPVPSAPVAPAPNPSSPICSGAALILLPVALIAWKTRKSRHG